MHALAMGTFRRASNLLTQMSKQQDLPQLDNVELVPRTQADGGAPGFNFHFNFVLLLGLTILIALSYLVFG
jgi:hypothetical protein